MAIVSTIEDRYELGEILGEGGFGRVHRARDKELNRTVAIKILDPRWDAVTGAKADELRARFRREAKATAQIRHPHVVTIFDVGELPDGEVFLVMEYLEGFTLSQMLDHIPYFTPDRAVPQILGCLEGLAQGHAKGIVHKDLKPSNLILTRGPDHTETLRVIDFGIARVLHEQKLTITGRIVGTPRYLAPEYITDMLVTPALDVYQMGLILVEMLSGEPCIPSEMSQVTSCQRHLSGHLTRPNYLMSGVLGRVLDRALATDHTMRFQNAGEFANALREIDLDELSEQQPTVGIKAIDAKASYEETLKQYGQSNPYESTENDEEELADTEVDRKPPVIDQSDPSVHQHFLQHHDATATGNVAGSNSKRIAIFLFIFIVGVSLGVGAFVLSQGGI